MADWPAIRAEFRESLPKIIAGKDPFKAGHPRLYTADTQKHSEHRFETVKNNLYLELCRAAEAKERIPPMPVLMERCGTTQQRIEAAFNCLLRDGLIEVWGNRARNNKHGVIILETGARTR